MKRALSPRLIVPLVLGIAIIAILLGSSNVGHVLNRASRFQPIYLLLICVLLVGYQALRAWQWALFLRVLDESISWRAALMSYMGGELAKALPGGQYFQTYLLRQAQGLAIACSAAATTIIIWLEVVVCLAVVLVLGVGPWGWVRPVAFVLLLGIVGVATAVKRRPLSLRLKPLTPRHRLLATAWAWYDDFAGCADMLLRPRTLVAAGALSAGYIFFAALALWAIAAALGLQSLGWQQALIAYAFSLGIGLIIPIPIDLGLTELSGVGVLLAIGGPDIQEADALTLMLVQRVLSTLFTGTVALVSLTMLRRQVVAAIRAEAVTDKREPTACD